MGACLFSTIPLALSLVSGAGVLTYCRFLGLGVGTLQNDCLSGLQWAYDNREKLGSTGQILITGESGGGNLSIATALKATKEGKKIVSGVYSLCP